MHRAIISLTNNNVIGVDNDVIFKNKNDLTFFRKMTLNNNIIMGNNTFKNIGRALDNRVNYVLTKSTDNQNTDNLIYFNNISEINLTDAWIIGGKQVLEIFQDKIDEWYITHFKLDAPNNKNNIIFDIDFLNDWESEVLEKDNEYTIIKYTRKNENN